MLMRGSIRVFGLVETSVLLIMYLDAVNRFHQIITEILIAGLDTRRMLCLPVAGLILVPYQAGILGQCLVALKPVDIANFSNDTGGINRTDALNGR